MKKKIEFNFKNIIILILVICILSSVSSYLSTSYALAESNYPIHSENVQYRDDFNLGANDVQAAINGTCSNISTVLSSLKPVEYIKPTPVDGVSITRGGYTMLGNICVVNMVVSIDTSKLSISTNSNTASQTIIATGMPIPKEDVGYLNSSYNSPTFKSGISYATSVSDDTLRFYQNSQYTYTSSYGIVISGMYLVA